MEEEQESARADAPEPWMRGTHAELEPVVRAVVHALELAEEDVTRWCVVLTEPEMFANPAGLPSVAFHLRHIARSLDRLLTYAEGTPLNESQLAALKTESEAGTLAEVLEEFRVGVTSAKKRVTRFGPDSFAEERGIGRKRLPTTVAGLLIHCAEHTARHVGQAVTTAKLATAAR
jgi:uncharacterized damage-inducible protein DinB